MLSNTHLSKSCFDKGFETRRSRQAYFLKFSQSHFVEPDQWLGTGPLWNNVVALYANDIARGHNINLKELRAQTVREYLEAINDLFTERGYKKTVDFNNKLSPSTIFYNDVLTWEEEPNRRTHITPEFLDEFFRLTKEEANDLEFIPAMLDWTLLGRYTGSRLAEYGQATQKRVEYHETPHGKKHHESFLSSRLSIL